MYPVIFNLHVAGVTMQFRQKTSSELSISQTYRLDGSLFYLRRLQCPAAHWYGKRGVFAAAQRTAIGWPRIQIA